MGWSCGECEARPELKEIRGCTEDSKSGEPIQMEGEVIRRCPLSLLRPASIVAMGFFSLLEKGVLPDPGAFTDQTYKYTVSMMVVAEQLGKMQRMKIKDMEQQAKARQGHRPAASGKKALPQKGGANRVKISER